LNEKDPRVQFIIVQDFKENRRKCTARPLEGVAGIECLRLRRPRPGEPPAAIPGGIWLDVGAPPLAAEDRALLEGGGRVIVLDASWARVDPLSHRLRVAEGARAERRSLPGRLVTAYPRRSKLREDPPAGLATVEAVFAVTVVLGEPRPELLEGYRWAPEFLRLNAEALRDLGWDALRDVPRPGTPPGADSAPRDAGRDAPRGSS
jgi:pre-rRNA-processing protein TSR3